MRLTPFVVSLLAIASSGYAEGIFYDFKDSWWYHVGDGKDCTTQFGVGVTCRSAASVKSDGFYDVIIDGVERGSNSTGLNRYDLSAGLHKVTIVSSVAALMMVEKCSLRICPRRRGFLPAAATDMPMMHVRSPVQGLVANDVCEMIGMELARNTDQAAKRNAQILLARCALPFAEDSTGWIADGESIGVVHLNQPDAIVDQLSSLHPVLCVPSSSTNYQSGLNLAL